MTSNGKKSVWGKDKINIILAIPNFWIIDC